MARATISSLFGTSPVKPLQSHMDSVQECVLQLYPYFESALVGDWKQARKTATSISRAERKADKLKKNLRMHLPKSLFMPVSRRDLLEILTMQDKIANRTKDIAGLVSSRKMQFPEDLSQQLLTFVGRSIDAAKQAQTAINELDELLEAGFRGNEIKVIEDMITKLDDIEHDTDTLQRDLHSQMFKREKDLPPVDVMFIYRVIDWIGDVADLAQRVGSRLQLLLAR